MPQCDFGKAAYRRLQYQKGIYEINFVYKGKNYDKKMVA